MKITPKALHNLSGSVYDFVPRVEPASPAADAAPTANSDTQPAAPRDVAPAAPIVDTAPARPRAPDIVELLLELVDNAPDDAKRAAIISAAPVEAREQLGAALLYREFSTAAGRNPALAALVAALDTAKDDAARAALIAGATHATREALADHVRWRSLSTDAAADRYLDLVMTV